MKANKYAQHRKKALCYDCSQKAQAGMSRCLRCLEAIKSRRTKRIDLGLCECCGQRAEVGRRKCRPHMDRDNRREAVKMNTRRKSGLCVACGKRRISKGSVSRCRPCLDRTNNAERRWRPERRKKSMNYRRRLRSTALQAYGGRCACCGEAERNFLCIDHVEDNGAVHRREIGGTGDRIYRWLRDNGYPDGFQLLCANCNMGKHLENGTCPHRKSKSLRLAV